MYDWCCVNPYFSDKNVLHQRTEMGDGMGEDIPLLGLQKSGRCTNSYASTLARIIIQRQLMYTQPFDIMLDMNHRKCSNLNGSCV